MDLETLWYEAFPYLCGAGGAVSLLTPHGSILLKASGVLLVAASVTILRLRWQARRATVRRMPPVSEAARRAAADTPDDDL